MKADLCGRCAAMKAATHEVRKVAGGVDHKVTCAECGRRRYGGTYDVTKKGGAGRGRG